MAAAGRVRIPALETGVPDLDVVLGGGLPRLSLTILGGGPGTGKTTLAQQMLFHFGTAGWPGLSFSILGSILGEPTIKLVRYQQQFAFFDPARVGSDVIYVVLADEVRCGPGRALKMIMAEVERHAPILVVVGSFRAIDELARGGKWRAVRTFIHDLAVLLASWDTTSLLIGEYGEQAIETEPGFATADGILWLSQQVRQNSIARKLRVAKLRGQAAMPGRHSFRITEVDSA